MEIPLEKFKGGNFHTWKVKIQMQLMIKNLWRIVKGIEITPTKHSKLIDWQTRDDKAKVIIGLAIYDSKLHLIDLGKSCK